MAVHCALKMISRLIKQVKLEAMLFQLSILTTISNILDSPIAKRPEHEELYATCKYITRRFFAVAKENPALFVEVLVWKRPAECEEILSGYGKRVHEQSRRQQLEEMAMSGGGSGGGSGSAGVGTGGPGCGSRSASMPSDVFIGSTRTCRACTSSSSATAVSSFFAAMVGAGTRARRCRGASTHRGCGTNAALAAEAAASSSVVARSIAP